MQQKIAWLWPGRRQNNAVGARGTRGIKQRPDTASWPFALSLSCERMARSLRPCRADMSDVMSLHLLHQDASISVGV